MSPRPRKQKPAQKEYEFRIAAYSLDSLPMNRLAEYMADLATVLGEHQSVHFTRLKPGSVNIAWKVEPEAEPKVRSRLRIAKTSDERNEITNAVRSINRRLALDNAEGEVIDPHGTTVLEFSGKRKFTQQVVGPFNQPGTVDGIPIRVGGQGSVVPIHLQEPNGSIHICHATRPIAIEIARYLFSQVIRVEGLARMSRDADGTWIQEPLRIHSFRLLDTAPLEFLVAKLRAIPSDLREIPDPLSALEAMRRDEQTPV